jgi:TetR/AcrR family transcriptional regulator, regulator of autoinduction and epiphytic fitness
MAVVKETGLTHRQRQAMQTRTLIVDAARSLFVSRGYAATSLEAVAELAGVASRTVYSVFGNKKALLGAICEAWLAEAGIPEAIAEGLREPNLRRRLLIVARASRRQWELERGTSALLQGAAASDAEVARMLAGWKEDRGRAWRSVVEGLESQLRPGVDARRAVALIRALTPWEVYVELVPGEGWTADDYEEWLGGLLTDLLLPPA